MAKNSLTDAPTKTVLKQRFAVTVKKAKTAKGLCVTQPLVRRRPVTLQCQPKPNSAVKVAARDSQSGIGRETYQTQGVTM